MAKVIGIRPTVYDFTDKSGREVHSEGFTFYTIYPQKDTEGSACEKIYLAGNKVDVMPAIGDEVEVAYNRFGKASGLKVVG